MGKRNCSEKYLEVFVNTKTAAGVPANGTYWPDPIIAGPSGAIRPTGLNPAPLSWWQFPTILLANAFKVHPETSLTGAKHQLKFVARGLTMPHLTQQWFEFWQSPKLAPLAALHPRLLLKLQRPYLRHGLEAEERWHIVQQHYTFATRHFPAAVLKRIFTAPGMVLAEVPAMEAGQFSLRLAYNDLFEKEGELSLMFYDEQKATPLFALSFCVEQFGAERSIFIGGLQGCKRANAREDIVAITRGMFGLRPKALLLFGLQQFAALWNFSSVRAASNDTRDLRRRQSSIKADYDEFWLDSGGQLQADGNFALPAAFVPRDLAEIKPNKRGMYRRRYEMLAGMAGQIHEHLHRLDCVTDRPFQPAAALKPASQPVAGPKAAPMAVARAVC